MPPILAFRDISKSCVQTITESRLVSQTYDVPRPIGAGIIQIDEWRFVMVIGRPIFETQLPAYHPGVGVCPTGPTYAARDP